MDRKRVTKEIKEKEMYCHHCKNKIFTRVHIEITEEPLYTSKEEWFLCKNCHQLVEIKTEEDLRW